MKVKSLTPSSKPKSFREIRYDEKRDAMIKSAIKAFGSKGFHVATLEDITNELKMTKGSVYYYFKTKEDLLYEAHLSSLGKVLKEITRINKSKEPPDAKIKAAIRAHLEILARDFEGAFLLQHEFQLPEKLLQNVISMRKLYEANFTRILEEGIEAGVFRIRNARMCAFIIFGAVNWFLKWYSSTGSWTVKEITEAHIDLICNGLLSKRQSV